MHLLCVVSLCLALSLQAEAMEIGQRIPLPEPGSGGEMSVKEALSERRSIREFSRDDLVLQDLSELLWAAQGITGRGGLRTAPCG